MNIFETIGKVRSDIEQYHSQFLTDALTDSLNGDRSLFEAIWRLVAPPDWEIPAHAKISSEERVESGSVDICVRCVSPHDRVVGIEVKTVDASATPGQLERYHEGLVKKYPGSAIQIAYLTPFNQERIGGAVGSRPTISEFEEFSRKFPQARHISWLDVADIPWDGNFLWRQHQTYVRAHISAPSKLRVNTERNRGLAVFFGEEAAQNFWEELALLEIYEGENGTAIDFAEIKGDLPSFAESLVRAFEVLLDNDNVSRNANKADGFPAELRQPFLDSKYHEVHAVLFGLAERHAYAWVQGQRDYAVRTAHKNHSSSGVSLFRSDGPGRIVVGERR